MRREALLSLPLLLAGAAVPFVLSHAPRPGELVVVVFVDLNGNGSRDEGEPGFPGLSVVLDETKEAITDELGRAFFQDVAETSVAVSLHSEAVQVVRDHGLAPGQTSARLALRRGTRSELAFALRPEGFLTVDVTELTLGRPLGAQGVGSAGGLAPATGVQSVGAGGTDQTPGCGCGH